jgi:hypothetical protein
MRVTLLTLTDAAVIAILQRILAGPLPASAMANA